MTYSSGADYVQIDLSAGFPPPPSPRLRQRVLVGVAGVVIVLVAAWLSLIVVSRIDELFFPGEGIGGLPSLPGVAQGGGDLEGQINLLVLGLDRRPHETPEVTRTDTMFIVTIDAQSGDAGLLGIPRDLWVEIPVGDGEGYYQERINTAFPTGAQRGYAGGGPGLLKDVVEHNLGIEIDHYVIIDFEGFIEVIDELGGVDVYVEQEINDPFYSRTELPGDYYPLTFEVGEQHLDGEAALDYSRTRFGASDLDRIQRQQQVIFAAIDKATERGLLDFDSLVGLWRNFKDAVDTDINDIQAPGFARLASRIDPTEITALSLGAATYPWTTPDGAAVLLVDKAIVQQLVQAFFVDSDLAEEGAFVEVQNSAGADGLADDVIAYLGQFGFSSDALAAAAVPDTSIKPQTEIIDFTGNERTVERLAALLSVPADRIRRSGEGDAGLRTVAGADILVILGADAQTRDFSLETSDTSGPAPDF